MFDSMDLNSLLPRSSQDATESSSSESDTNDAGCFMALTWQERLIGCGACMILGYLLSFGSFFRFKDLMLGDPLPFVLHTTVGNIIALTGSCFLTGPKSQWNKMMHETRKVATVAYLGSLGMTLLVAFLPMFLFKGLLLLGLLLIQYVAITWYCLSYIPYARQAVRVYINRLAQNVDG